MVLVLIDYRIVESGFVGVADNLCYLFVVASDAFNESLLIVFESYAVERHR